MAEYENSLFNNHKDELLKLHRIACRELRNITDYVGILLPDPEEVDCQEIVREAIIEIRFKLAESREVSQILGNGK